MCITCSALLLTPADRCEVRDAADVKRNTKNPDPALLSECTSVQSFIPNILKQL